LKRGAGDPERRSERSPAEQWGSAESRAAVLAYLKSSSGSLAMLAAIRRAFKDELIKLGMEVDLS
jgi:hypothetical protein